MLRNTVTKVDVNHKLLPKFRGPYIVREVIGNDRYVVGDIPGYQLSQRPFVNVYSSDRGDHSSGGPNCRQASGARSVAPPDGETQEEKREQAEGERVVKGDTSLCTFLVPFVVFENKENE
jgi:hypothetical protein